MALGRARQPQPVQTKSVTDYQADALDLQGMRQLGQKRELDLIEHEFRIEDQERARADEEKFSELFERHGGDIEAAFPEMLAINPATAFKIREMEDQARQRAGQSLRQHLENDLEMRRQSAMVVDELDEESWEEGREALASIDPDLAQAMPQQFDPEWVESTVGMSMTEREKDEAQMQGLTEIMSGEVNQGYARWLSRAGEEDWHETVQAARELGIPDKVIRQYPTQWPGEEAAEQIRLAGMDPRDQAALERSQMTQDYNEQYLEYLNERNRIDELKILQGQGGPEGYESLFGTGTPKSALWKLKLMELGKDYPDGEIPSEALYAAAEEIGSVGGGAPTDATAQRAADRIVADWLVENPQPTSDADPEEQQAWQEEYGRVARAAQVAAGRVSYEEAGAPYAGGRETAYSAMKPQTIARIEGILREAKMPVTPANVEQFLADNPGIEEGVPAEQQGARSGRARTRAGELAGR
jgi:hypothetical protein